MSNRAVFMLGLALTGLLGAGGCAALGSDADFPPPVPPATATRFKATPPNGLPVDVYLSAWGEGYVIHTPGATPIYLISDKRGGFVLQRLGQSASFVAPLSDGQGWSIMSGSGPATYLLKQEEGSWILQSPGGLPTLIVPQ
jgi:hypothetical protein